MNPARDQICPRRARLRLFLRIGRGAARAAPLLGLILSLPGGAFAASIFVASQEAGQLARIETGTRTVAATVDVQAGPAALATDAHGRIYLSHPDHGAITVVEGGTNRVLRRLPYHGQPFGIAADPDGRFVYVGDWKAGQVARLNAETGAVDGTVTVGKDPANLVLGRDGRIWVADRESHQVSVIDSGRMQRIATIPVGEGPFALALSPAQERLYVANVRSNDLSIIDTAALKVLATVPVGAMPYGVATSTDGSRILVTNQHAGTVSVIDAADLRLADTIKVGRYPESIVVSGASAYVANWFSEDVSVIDLASLREIARIRVGEGPRYLGVTASDRILHSGAAR
jgi:YVTN family beta-propeller protein